MPFASAGASAGMGRIETTAMTNGATMNAHTPISPSHALIAEKTASTSSSSPRAESPYVNQTRIRFDINLRGHQN
jgi:hypothetical protein